MGQMPSGATSARMRYGCASAAVPTVGLNNEIEIVCHLVVSPSLKKLLIRYRDLVGARSELLQDGAQYKSECRGDKRN
jgi:hypothetical protein